MDQKTFELELAGRKLKATLSDLARQASGSVLLEYGQTTVLATAVMSEQDRQDADFFPLTVEYEERYYAAGKILGSRFIRRESRPSDEAILTARLIDRTIRPRFPKHLKREVQVVLTCLSWDKENDPDIIGLIAASLALSISNIPWQGPVSAVRIGQEEGGLILNPVYSQREKGSLDLVFSGLNEGKDVLINMIEGEASEAKEEDILKATEFSLPFLREINSFQEKIKKEAGREKTNVPEPDYGPDLEKDVKDFLKDKLEKAVFHQNKKERRDDLKELKEDLVFFVNEKYSSQIKTSQAKELLEKNLEELVAEKAVKSGQRPDGRKIDELREISSNVGMLPITHGSGLFVRGQTQALSILTLGSPSDVRLLEGMEIRGKKRFMHHYNFPPYSSGEIKPMRGPGRREIGHGMLAEKALMPLVPSFEDFPYTMRIVTEILSSNGSTSMASVSAASLALMDAGVPVKEPAAGIAVGIMTQGKDYKILTDIQGPEDHYGGMDFKVAGTKNGITAIQMDVKIEGISKEIIKEALDRARAARLEILENMAKTIEKPRAELSPYAPRIYTLQINPQKIREVIGPGGKIINEIIDECGVSIDIEPTGKIFITSEKDESAKKALDWIKNITREVKAGELFQGKVKRILNFGAFVEILPGQEGLVHISQLAPHRVEKVEDIVKIGDVIPVKVVSVDEQGRINLSLKEARQK